MQLAGWTVEHEQRFEEHRSTISRERGLAWLNQPVMEGTQERPESHIAMSSRAVLKASKKNLRNTIKKVLSNVPAESIDTQSRLRSSISVNCC